MIETCQDPLQVKAAINAALDARDEVGLEIPIFVSVTMEVTGTMLVGTEMAAAIAILEPYPIDLIALNCATGPREMGEHVGANVDVSKAPLKYEGLDAFEIWISEAQERMVAANRAFDEQ